MYTREKRERKRKKERESVKGGGIDIQKQNKKGGWGE